MKLLFTLAVLAGFVAFYVLSSGQGHISKYHSDFQEGVLSSVNPPAAKTGAPGETSCTSCHAGTAQSAAGIVDVTFSGSSDEYIVGQTYSITISIATGTKNGFQMTILDDDHIKAGTFTAGTNSSVTNSGGRQYIRQNVSSGILSWTFSWTAPDEDAGDLTMFYSFNKSNAMGNSSGDVIYLGQYNLTSAVFNTVTEHERADAGYTAFYDQLHGELNLVYSIEEKSKVVVSIQDLSGRLISQTDLGNQSEGNYTEKIAVPAGTAPGIYIVSLLVNNNVYNRKVAVN